MPRLPALLTVRRFLRCAICPGCRAGAPATPRHDPTLPRPCERDCAIFARLPTLWRIASAADPMLRTRPAVRRDLLRRLPADRGPARVAEALLMLSRL